MSGSIGSITAIDYRYGRQLLQIRKGLPHWLQKNHAKSTELVVVFYKEDSGKPSITYPEARDQALRFGWIDGVRRALDNISYSVRFTPRKPRSIWSNVNIGRVEELTKLGQVTPAGVRAFEAATANVPAFIPSKTGRPCSARSTRKNSGQKESLGVFQSMPPWYRRTAIYRVMSTKKEETRVKRLRELIADSEKGLSIKELRRK